MAKLKKIAAALTAAVMCGTMLTGCADTNYAVSYGDSKVNAGVYIYNMLSEMSYRMQMMYYIDGITENYFDQKVEDKSFSDYLSDYALNSTKEYAAVVENFNKLKLSLSDDELKEINDSVREAWESAGDFYESEGISKDSVKLVQKAAKMREMIFDYYYGEGGKEEVTDDDIVKYLNDNYIRYKEISIAKSTDEDKDKAAEADKESKEKIDKYLKEAKGLSFEEFDTIIDEYNVETSAESESTDSEAAESEIDSSSESDRSSESGYSQAAEDSSLTEESSSDESSNAESSSEAEVESEAELEDTSSQTDTEDEEAEQEEEDPYANETMTNYGTMTDEDKSSDSGKLLEKVNGLDVGVATAYEDDNYYYIIIKGDVKERSEEYATENHDNMVHEMKSEDFEKIIDGWVEELNINVNSQAVKRYTPQVVYDKQEEYYSKNQNN